MIWASYEEEARLRCYHDNINNFMHNVVFCYDAIPYDACSILYISTYLFMSTIFAQIAIIVNTMFLIWCVILGRKKIPCLYFPSLKFIVCRLWNNLPSYSYLRVKKSGATWNVFMITSKPYCITFEGLLFFWVLCWLLLIQIIRKRIKSESNYLDGIRCFLHFEILQVF